MYVLINKYAHLKEALSPFQPEDLQLQTGTKTNIKFKCI